MPVSSETTAHLRRQLDALNPQGYRSLLDAFDDACQRTAERPALACMDCTIDFRQLDRLSRDFGAYLTHGCGLLPGERIVIQLPNVMAYPIVAWGALRAGLVIVNTNPLYTEREFAHQLTDSGAVAIITMSELRGVAEQVAADSELRCSVLVSIVDMQDDSWPDALAKSGDAPNTSLPDPIGFLDALGLGQDMETPEWATDMDTVAMLQYTGGTTGLSKGVVLSHGNLFAATRQANIASETIPVEREVVIGPMPMYHIYGFCSHVLSLPLRGGLSVLIPDPRNTDKLIQAMRRYPFTGMAGINTLFASLLRHPEFDSVDFSHVRGVVAGGMTLVSEIAEEWQRRVGSRIYEGYGLSETSAITTVNTIDAHKDASVGLPMAATEVKVVDDNGDAVDSGERGEVLVRGPQVMRGYWNRDEATESALDDEGWLRTGDIGILDEDGFLRIVDRVKDMVLVSGFNVYPGEVESVAHRHPDVAECAVIGVPDAKSGEAVKLFVVSTNPELSAEDMRAFCATQLTAYKVPRHVEFRDELPKSNVGKVLRRVLRDAD